MKKITLSIFVLACFLCSSILQAQIKSNTKRTSKPSPDGIYRCSSDEYNAELLKQYPNMMGSKSFEKKLENKIKELKASRTLSVNGATLVRIPVVVHVIHNGTAIGVGANISDAQVLSQIQVLNEDFRKMAGTRGENSHPDGADTNIEFYLAREDADCNPTTGIDRLDLSSISTTWSGPGGNSDSVLKPMTIWDPSRYLNMWTVTLDDNTLLGYAQFPGGPAETDGVVMGYEYFGSNDAPGVDLNSSSPYDLGRTTTHEVGHFLGLYHIFDGGCSDGDLVADTPPTADTDGNYGCPTGLDSCPIGTPDGILDMIENYMDYTNDDCMNIFTNGQSARMDAVLAGSRSSLANSTVPDTPLASVNYDGSIKITNLNLDACAGTFTPEVRLTNYGTVTLTSATISYDLNNGTPVNYNWTGSLAEGQSELVSLPLMVTPVGSNDFNVEVSQSNTDQRACNDTDSDSFIGASYETTTQIHLTLNTDDYGEEISWEFKDSSNTVLYSQTYNNSPANDNATFNYSFDVVVDECYTFTISDSAGDGICCSYGIGSYELRTDDNTLIVSGGSYAFSETTTMSTTALSMDDYFKNNRVKIFPNPTQNDLTISLLNPRQLPNGFQVYNMLGQAIFSKSISTEEDLKINTSVLSNGMYFIKISKGSRSIAIPFIKK